MTYLPDDLSAADQPRTFGTERPRINATDRLYVLGVRVHNYRRIYTERPESLSAFSVILAAARKGFQP